jgi:predicted DNA binding protein
MAAKGRDGARRHPESQPRGEAHHMAKLTEEQVRMIRTDPRGSHRLAKALGVSKPTIMRIRHRKTWRHVD